MMFVSIVGQASFHTTGPSGPSMIDRSYRLADAGAGGSAEATGAGVGVVEAELKGPGGVDSGTSEGATGHKLSRI